MGGISHRYTGISRDRTAPGRGPGSCQIEPLARPPKQTRRRTPAAGRASGGACGGLSPSGGTTLTLSDLKKVRLGTIIIKLHKSARFGRIFLKKANRERDSNQETVDDLETVDAHVPGHVRTIVRREHQAPTHARTSDESTKRTVHIQQLGSHPLSLAGWQGPAKRFAN